MNGDDEGIFLSWDLQKWFVALVVGATGFSSRIPGGALRKHLEYAQDLAPSSVDWLLSRLYSTALEGSVPAQ